MKKNLSKLKVFGIGGCGIKIVSKIKKHNHVSKILIDTDISNINNVGTESSNVDISIICGYKTCRGLGCGGNPSIGFISAKETFSDLIYLFSHNYINIFVIGLGGGAGSGITNLILRKLMESDNSSYYNKYNIIICTSPLKIEQRMIETVKSSLKKICKNADVIFLIDMESIKKNLKQKIRINTFFNMINNRIIEHISNLSKKDNDEILEFIENLKRKNIIRINDIDKLKNYVT